jgi:hypothetical protein
MKSYNIHMEYDIHFTQAQFVSQVINTRKRVVVIIQHFAEVMQWHLHLVL